MNEDTPIIGEKISTKEGDAYVLNIQSFDDIVDMDPDVDVEYRLRSRIGVNFRDDYYRVEVRLIGSGEIKNFDCWEVSLDADRNIEDAPWRDW